MFDIYVRVAQICKNIEILRNYARMKCKECQKRIGIVYTIVRLLYSNMSSKAG